MEIDERGRGEIYSGGVEKMETIRGYLETMFQNMPNLPQVQKAKYELGQMMEDKYQELMEEGKNENEAVAIVISEFGNLDELAEELGIETVVSEDAIQSRKISLEEAKQYIQDQIGAGYKTALGVLFCIMAPCGPILADGYQNDAVEAVGVIVLFLLVAAAVGLFVFAHMSMGKWKFLKQQSCSIDFITAEYVNNEKENFRMTNALMITIGVVLCVFSVIPVIVFDELIRGLYMEEYGVSLMFLSVAIGVFLFVAAGNKKKAYETMLRLNAKGTMGAAFVPSQKTQLHYKNKNVEEAMSVYWETVTCIYLCWSFLSFDWGSTWIIWPVAAIASKMIQKIWGERN